MSVLAALFAVGAASEEVGSPTTDKKAFIVAVSKLGVSATSDTALLTAISGAPVLPLEAKIPFRDAHKRYETSARFVSQDRIMYSFSYVYSFRGTGEYISIIRFRLNTDSACVTLDDLSGALGAPTRLPRAPPTARFPSRSNAIWAAEYVLDSGASATFVFSHARCTASLNVAVNLS